MALGRLRDYLMAEDVDRAYYVNSDTSAEALSGVGLPRTPVDGELVVRFADARFSWPKVCAVAGNGGAAGLGEGRAKEV